MALTLLPLLAVAGFVLCCLVLFFVVLPSGPVVVVGGVAGAGSVPCSWQCDDPQCSAPCDAVCDAPQCTQVAAGTVAGSGFSLVNVDASLGSGSGACTVRCPGDQVATEECPQCETVCGTPEADKVWLCASTNCSWRATSPNPCPKPTCTLVCSEPACAAPPV